MEMKKIICERCGDESEITHVVWNTKDFHNARRVKLVYDDGDEAMIKECSECLRRRR